MEIGLVYGDILLYRQLFSGKDTTQKSYEERKEELKKKLKRTQTKKNSKFVTKLLQDQSVTKRNVTSVKETSILQVIIPVMQHTMSCIRRDGNITTSTSQNQVKHTWLHFETGFKDLRTYALAQREKKKAIHSYLYYPRSLWKLELHPMKNG